ncbi:MAG: hypothetical protein R8N24_00360 [Alphaproteobacteria bacterium]|nr:hypothetical protein [Alphaproteobacteria bacterium]
MWYAKILLIIATLGVSVIDTSVAAPARRSTRNSATTQQFVPSTSARSAVSARSARSATPVATTTGEARTMSARSATPAKTTPTVTARAATTQSPINNGTKVNAATKTTANSECQNLYNACMDSFCVIDNVDGGRCVCSDKFKTFEKLHNEINDINLQAYKLTTLGVEKIHATVSKNTALDIDSMQTAPKTDLTSALDMWGNTLRTTAHDACVAQIPQCANNLQMMSMMYSGTINSDCIGYENSLKNLRANAKQQLQLAEGNLREIALDSAKNANKYDLGQCTIKFKECMQTTAGCGEDFTGCVDIVNQNKARILNNQTEQLFKIPNTTANLSIAKSMYDVLQSKAPMCQSVLNQCVKVKDQVFNAFLRESYPELKIAQDTAEYNVRTDCISNVSKCFQKACKDNIDPNDPDGSYDACLMRPEMVLTFCKPELDLCGVNTKDAKTAKQSLIWDYVLAVLASMKVDACTVELKDCLTNENRCGPDYSNCVGLSTDTIIRMCPYDKLMGCQNVYDKDLKEDFVYDNISQTVQGIILNIDNKLLNYCQAAVDAAATRACGDDLSCPGFFNLNTVGTTSLDYKICEYVVVNEDVLVSDHCHRDQSLIPDVDLGRVEYSATGELGPVVPYTIFIDVPIYWESITVDDNGNFNGLDDYVKNINDTGMYMTEAQQSRLESELFTFRDNMQHVFDAIEQDPTVEYCMRGRRLDGVELKRTTRFPNITKSMRIKLANMMLQKAKNNYYKKYDAYTQRSLQDYVKIAERQADIKGENAKDLRREIARQSCVALAEMSALPKSTEPHNVWGEVLVGLAIALAMAFLVACTYGTVLPAVPAVLGTWLTETIVGVGVPLTVGGLTASAVVHQNTENTSDVSHVHDYNGEYKITHWNYKEEITTVFNPTDLTCEKCTVSTRCEIPKNPMFGEPYCEAWEESLPKKCTTIEF